MKARREIILVAGGLLLLIALTILGSIYQSKQEQVPALSSNSNAPEGARALGLNWPRCRILQRSRTRGTGSRARARGPRTGPRHPSRNSQCRSPDRWGRAS